LQAKAESFSQEVFTFGHLASVFLFHYLKLEKNVNCCFGQRKKPFAWRGKVDLVWRQHLTFALT
jgi:hypothetical protein